MAIKKPSTEALEVLKQCTIEGNNVKLPPEQLERTLYTEVKKHLELIGGKWKGGKVQAFVFDFDPTELLAAQANGDGRDLKKEYQFFPTPGPVAMMMMEHLPLIKVGAKILEPSSGTGDLINAFHHYYPDVPVDYFELMEINRKRMESVPMAVYIGDDFLTDCRVRDYYDVIIANPPYTGNQDIDHIMKMYDVLKPGGTLIALSSPSWMIGEHKKQKEFRTWVDQMATENKPLPAGSFKESGTNIAPIMLVIEKPALKESSFTNQNHIQMAKGKPPGKGNKPGNGFGKNVDVIVKDEMSLYHNMVGKTTSDKVNADGQYPVDFGPPTGIQQIHADDLDLAPDSNQKKANGVMLDSNEIANKIVDLMSGGERPYIILAASVKDGFCDYTFEITQGTGLGDKHKVSGSGEIEDDLRHAFGSLIVHLAVIDDVFRHSGITIDEITNFEVHELTALYHVSGFQIKGSEANESVVLKGSKRVSTAGGRIDLSSPKIPLDNKSSYPFFKELKAAVDHVREEVALYKEGKYIPVEEENKHNPNQLTIDSMVSTNNDEDTDGAEIADEFEKAAV